MNCIITRTKRHIETTPVTAGEYLRNEVKKKSAIQAEDKFDELVDHYLKLFKHKKQGRMTQLMITVQITPPT